MTAHLDARHQTFGNQHVKHNVMNARAQTINLLLYDGGLNGVISIEDSSWNSGEMYSAPRDSVEDLLANDACSKYGVYLLLSPDKVYVGQSSDLAKRLSQHIAGKKWWESAIILTTKDDSLNHADIDYLESVLIDKAFAVDRLDCDNKKKGAPPKVDKFRKVFLGQYLDEALFLMQLIGINVFEDGECTQNDSQHAAGTLAIDTMDQKTRLTLGRREKGEAIKFLKYSGIKLSKHTNYSTLQANRTEFWINPQTTMIDNDWEIILNDNQSCELVVLRIPANSVELESDSSEGLITRSDKPELIDLLINRETLIDKRSGFDFSPFVTARVPY